MKNKLKNEIYIIFSIIISLYVALFTGYVCPWRKFFHIYCAGCGVTRMIKSIIKLDLYQAFMYNQLFFILFFFFVIYLIYIILCKMIKISFFKVNNKILWLLLFLIIIFTILRNISYFSFLQPK